VAQDISVRARPAPIWAALREVRMTSRSAGDPISATSPPGTVAGTAGHLPNGYHLREFAIEGVLGEGGFSVVYLATDLRLERKVAIKEYMPTALATRDSDFSVHVRSSAQHREAFDAGLRSFINEAKLLARFEHPALVKVHQFWQEKGTAYMVMPFYAGPTLKTWFKQRTEPLGEDWILNFLRLTMDALETLHREQCLHRDVAPDNILVLNESTPLLLDFGAARRVIGDLTQALTVILKPGFAPIEQYAESASMRQGPWTDVYALAAVAHFMITGRAPAPAVSRVLADDATPLREEAQGRYSERLLVAVDAGLAVRPENRPQTIEELRRLLQYGPSEPPANRAVSPRPPEQDTSGAIDDDRTRIVPGRAPAGMAIGPGQPPSAAEAQPTRPATLQTKTASPSPSEGKGSRPILAPVLAGGAIAAVVVAAITLWPRARSDGPSVEVAQPVAAVPPAEAKPLAVETESRPQPQSEPPVAGRVEAVPAPEPPVPAKTQPAQREQRAALSAPSPAPEPVPARAPEKALPRRDPEPRPALDLPVPVGRPPLSAAPPPAPVNVVPVEAPAPSPTPQAMPNSPPQIAAVEPSKPASDSAPLRAIERPQPAFPREALRSGTAEGRVLARLFVRADGSVERVDIVQAAPRRIFDREVRETVLRWRFEPPGQPRQAEVEFEFRR
jgi:TonB family protein